MERTGGAGGVVVANGIEIAYEVQGVGPPLVMLHGASSSGRIDFGHQIPALSKTFRIHLPDARGHGSTRAGDIEGFGQELLVADLLALADALGLETFHLVGFSLGGSTALRFAARHPERLRTLVTIGTSPEREPRQSVARKLLDPDRIEQGDPRWAADLARRHDPAQGPGGWQRLLRAIVADIGGQRSLTAADLRRIELPTMVVCGDRDPFCPVGQAWSLQRQLPDARLLVVPGCGHEVAARRPGLFSEALAGFYRSTAATAREGGAAAESAADRAGQPPGGRLQAGPGGAPLGGGTVRAG